MHCNWTKTFKPAAALLALLLAGNGLARPLPYTADYDLYRNSKRIGEASVTLELMPNGDYRYSMNSKGTKGLARLLGATDSEYAEFRYRDGQFVPLKYETQSKVAGKKHHWIANFDWSQQLAVGSEDSEAFSVPLQSGTLDPITLSFALRQELGRVNEDMRYRLLDKNEIEEQRFSVATAEPIQIASGCTEGIRVERVRQNSQRFTISWYAPTTHQVLLRLDHGKHGKDTMSLRLQSLMVAGQPVTIGADCDS